MILIVQAHLILHLIVGLYGRLLQISYLIRCLSQTKNKSKFDQEMPLPSYMLFPGVANVKKQWH